MRNLDGRVKIETAIAPQVQDGDGAVDGATIVRDKNYEELIVPASLGAATGTPDSLSAVIKAQHRADNGESWEDYGDPVTITDTDPDGFLHLDAKGMKNEFKIVATVAFVNGTTPTVPVSAVAIYGEPKYL